MHAAPKSFPRHRRVRPFLAFALLASVACLEHTVHYSQAQDDSAMALIASSWAEPTAGGLVPSLCEDVAASDGWAGPDCEEEHVVRGGGRALEHTESHSTVGCGGCLFSVQAYVVGTLSGGPLAAPVAVRGTVYLQSGWDDDPYELPWGFALRCDAAGDCELHGRVLGDGTVEGDLAIPAAATPARHLLTRTGDATCP